MESLVSWLLSIPLPLRMMCFALLVILQVIIAIIPGEPFELAAGYLFGFYQGTVICLVSSAIGTSIIYFLVLRYGRKIIEKLFSEEKIRTAEELLMHKTYRYVWIVLYIIPGVPKDIICYVVPLLNIPFIPWLVISTIGRIPSIVTSTGLVHYIVDGQWGYVIALLMVIAILAIIGNIMQKMLGGKS